MPDEQQPHFNELLEKFGNSESESNLDITFKDGIEQYWQGMWQSAFPPDDQDSERLKISSQAEWNASVQALTDGLKGASGFGVENFRQYLNDPQWHHYIRSKFDSRFLEILRSVQSAEWQNVQDSFDLDHLTAYVELLRRRFPYAVQRDFSSGRLSVDEARKSLHVTNKPQMIIESILSNEWEHWGRPRSHHDFPAKPEICIRSDSATGASPQKDQGGFQGQTQAR